MINKIIKIVLPALLVTGLVVILLFAFLSLGGVNYARKGAAALGVGAGNTVGSGTKLAGQNIMGDTANLVVDGGNASAVALPPDPSWTANIPGTTWVGKTASEQTAGQTSEQGETYTFLKTFSIPSLGSVTGASLAVTTDNSFSASVNGVQVGLDDTPHNILPQLINGDNTLSFTVNDPASLLYKLEIETAAPAPIFNITVETPAADERLAAGTKYRITWKNTIPGGAPLPNGLATIDLTATPGGPAVYSITATPSILVGSYAWTIPKISPKFKAGDYYIKISGQDDAKNNVVGVSGKFSIGVNNCCMCMYGEAPQCEGAKESDCANVYSEGGTKDCDWDKTQGKCLSKFIRFCQNQKTNAGNTCDNFSIVADPYDWFSGITLDEKVSLITNFIDDNKCRNMNYFEEGHGNQLQCDVLAQTMNACTTCHGNCVGFIDRCSMLQNPEAVNDMAKNIQQTLVKANNKTGIVTINAQQAATSPKCKSTSTITVTFDKISIDYLKCSDLLANGGLCLQVYQKATCANPSPNGKSKIYQQYMCCPKTQTNVKLGTGIWTIPNYINVGGFPAPGLPLCPDDTFTSGLAEGKGIAGHEDDQRFVMNAYRKSLKDAADTCSKKGGVFEPGALDIKKSDGMPYYSSTWFCISLKTIF